MASRKPIGRFVALLVLPLAAGMGWLVVGSDLGDNHGGRGPAEDIDSGPGRDRVKEARDGSPERPGFHLGPYLQNPAPQAMTVSWLSHDREPGQLRYRAESGGQGATVASVPVLATELASEPVGPYFHRVRLTDLEPGTSYRYEVTQGSERYQASFRTAPGPGARVPVRFIAVADCETTPASIGDRATWGDPTGGQPERRYLVDQARGLVDNLSVIAARNPDFVTISGDLVEASGDLPDWHELWRNLIDCTGSCVFAPRLPIIAVPGNHEYWAGPNGGGFDQPASERAIQRFLRYFEAPANHASRPEHEGRYFRLDYGPVTIIGLDVCNDAPHESPKDTNFYLRGEGEPGGGHAPGFLPGTEQYRWLEEQLQDSQETSPFTVVLLHHVPYSVGPHGWPPGHRHGKSAWQVHHDPQSGTPVRGLTELFMRRGVDALIAGHDEMYERSEISGTEEMPGGATRRHTMQVYDIGICGDGLRSPQPELQNPHQKFLAHRDSPEQWRDGRLISGGKHYGHLEVNLVPRDGARHAGEKPGKKQDRDGSMAWRVTLEPVYILPLVEPDGRYTGHERKLYDDVVTLDVVAGPGGGASE